MRSPREARSPPRSRRRVPGKPQSVHGEFSALGRTPPGQAWVGGAPSVLGSQVGVAEGVQKGRAGPFSLAGGHPGFTEARRQARLSGVGAGPQPFVTGRRGCSVAWTAAEGLPRGRGSGAWEPAGPRAGGASPEPRPRGGLCADRPALLPCHRPLPRPPAPRSCKGISTFFARLLRRSPCTPKLSQARLLQAPSVRVRDTGGPGSWRSVPVPSLPPPPFVHRGRATRSQPSGPGAGPRPSFLSSPRQSQAARGRERAPRSPRQVREGCVHSFSCGEQVAPGSGPFCSLYFILKLYLMLLYERGRGGKRAVRHLYVQMSYLLCVYQR